ncbi:hypothetical protein KGP36_04105 [Patescibacteria group bacterium]|nr:hypothetical protein [Patescibacteria group bacterium]
MQKPQYTPDQEQELMAALWSPEIADNPEAFVMFAFPWGQPGTPLEHVEGPRRWQRRFLRRMAEHLFNGRLTRAYRLLRRAIASGRGPGKSALVAWLSLWFNSCHIGSTHIISANTETQLRNITFAELMKWQAMAINSHWFEISGLTMTPAKWLKELVERDLKKGTGYWGTFGKLWSEDNPDAYAGPHNPDGMMVTFDEGSGIPDAIWAVANGYFTEPTPLRFWFAFSQGRRNQGYFFECFNAKRDFWETEQIDARTVEGVDKAVYQEIIDEYGEDSDEARVEVYGEFPVSEDETFISYGLVKRAVERPAAVDPTAPVVIGVDPARTGSDWFVILIRQGRRILEIRRFKIDPDSEAGTMEGVGHIIDAICEFQPALTVIDETGLGGPIMDRVKEQRYRIRGVNFSWAAHDSVRFGNKRAEIWGAVKVWLRTATIPNDKRLIDDLKGPKKKPDSSGKMFLESKKEMKARGLASPDTADALAVTFAFPVAHRVYNGKRSSIDADTPATHTGWMGA